MKEAACMLIVKDDKFLGVSRKFDHSKFGFPGGKLEKDEKPKAASIRETLEETGLKVVFCVPLFTGLVGKVIVYTYLAVEYSGKINSTEEGKVEWITREELTKDNAAYPDYNKKVFDAYYKLRKISQSILNGRFK